MNCGSWKMRMIGAASELGLEQDRLDRGCPLFWPAQSPECFYTAILCTSQSRLGDLPGVEQQARVHFGENLAGDGSQQPHCLLEVGFLVLSTSGAAVCTVAKILKMVGW